MIAIVDCNSFYCSCERVFYPKLWKKPVVVLSNNDGCIISRTDEAKAAGVGMAAPFFMNQEIIQKNNVEVFSSNYHLYGDMSWRVMETLRSIAGEENVEVYSVDECFINIKEADESRLEEYALQIKQAVEQWTGVIVSVGIAPTKVLAKAANNLAKKNKVATNCVVVIDTPEKIDAALLKMPVNSIWGVGHQYAVKLNELNIYNAYELSRMTEAFVKRNLGGIVGVRLLKELQGIPAIDMEDELVSKKMIATTRMFGNPVTDLKDIKEAVATYTARAAEKLRRQHSVAGVISVFVVPKEIRASSERFRHGPMISNHFTLPVATSSTNELIKPALQLVESIYEEGNFYKKAGVTLSGLLSQEAVQSNMFAAPPDKAMQKLMHTLDNVNFSMRDDAVKFASSGTSRDWKMRQEYRSPMHTTRWNELREVS
ncbi:Y-family DNA polymerase [soil metagenome]